MTYNRSIIYVAGFLYTLAIALTLYINSSFLASFVGEEKVGIVYGFGSIFSLVALLSAPGVFRIIKGRRFVAGVSFLISIVFLLLAHVSHAFSAVIFLVLLLALVELVVFALDEFLKIFSQNEKLGRIRGIYVSVCHIAVISVQLLFFLFLGTFTFKKIYSLAAIVAFCFSCLMLYWLKKVPEPEYNQVNRLRFVGKFFKQKNLARAYVLNWLLQFFYVWMIIYTPLYLYTHLGFNLHQIGIILGFMLLPFLILPYALGKHGDKFGERKTLMFGFLVAALCTILLFFLHSHSVVFWALALFGTRVGAATIEVMNDTYFFKHILPENEEYVSVYRTATPAAYIIAPLLASLILSTVPTFNYIFAILGSLMLCGVYIASTIDRKDF